MYKLIVGLILFNFINAILGGAMEGNAGEIASTRLTSAITSDDTTFSVKNTQGFLKAGVIYLEAEEIRYTSKSNTSFTIASDGRGWNNTEAKAHAKNTMVYTEQVSMLNGIVGFNVASTSTTAGGINLMLLGWQLVWVTIPKLITWDFAHLTISEFGMYFRILFLAVSAGVTVVFFITLMSSFGGTAQSILRRA